MTTNTAGRRYWAQYVKRTVVELAVVAAAGIAIDRWNTSDYAQPNSLLEIGAISIGLYLGVSLLLSVLKLVSGVIYLWAFGGSDMEGTILADLRDHQFPAPSPYQSKTFDYFHELANDDAAPPAVRVRAASVYAAYQVAIKQAGFFGGLALAKALDDATLRFAQEAPQQNW